METKLQLNEISFLGITVNPLSMKELNQLILETVSCGARRVVANHNLHSIYLHHRDATLREFFEAADITHIDGMAVVILGRILRKPLIKSHRTTYVDWIEPLASMAERKEWRIFYLGSKPGVAEKGAAKLRARYPKLNMRVHDGYFNSDDERENLSVIAAINSFCPHLLLVGMGMPRQEKWILTNRNSLKTNVILPAGACMDYVAGEIATPPRWMGQVGVEWLYRLITEPRRLGARYLIEPWFILALLMKELFRQGNAGATRDR